MKWASWFGFEENPGYSYFLKYDFNYKLGWGKFRYVFVFLLQMSFFAFVVFLQSDLWKKIKQDARDRLLPFLFCMWDNELYHIASCFDRNMVGFSPVYECCNKLDTTFEDMYKLLYCIRRFKVFVYMDTLFQKYGNMLTKRQYIKYRDLFKKRFDIPLWESCRELDKKHGIQEDDEYRSVMVFIDSKAAEYDIYGY